MKKSTLLFASFATFLYLSVAFAADNAPAPELSAVLLALWGAIQNHASTAMILVPVFQFFRTGEIVGVLGKFSGKWLQAIIAFFTAGGFVLDAYVKGQPLLQALVTGLVTSGGAMLIYDAIRDIKKPAAEVAAK